MNSNLFEKQRQVIIVKKYENNNCVITYTF